MRCQHHQARAGSPRGPLRAGRLTPPFCEAGAPRPAFPKGDGPPALDSGLAMPTPDKIAAPTRTRERVPGDWRRKKRDGSDNRDSRRPASRDETEPRRRAGASIAPGASTTTAANRPSATVESKCSRKTRGAAENSKQAGHQELEVWPARDLHRLAKWKRRRDSEPFGLVGFTDKNRIRQQGAACENCHEDEFRSPAQEMIERTADQW